MLCGYTSILQEANMRKLLSLFRKRRGQRGQGMTEYIIIVALVAIGAIAVITVFGDNIRALFGTSANALAGTSTGDTGATEVDEDKVNRNLQDFAEFE